jgi:hypothetical protein
VEKKDDSARPQKLPVEPLFSTRENYASNHS